MRLNTDTSGSDEDLPPTHQNRVPRRGRDAGNGRSVVGSVPGPVYHETDMETQIHQFEQQAYLSVLRAFKAQADTITWEKEDLITELRKELRISDKEHRELLYRVNADDVIRRIREWGQRDGLQPGVVGNNQAVHDPVPTPTVFASREKQKTSPSVPSHSFDGPFTPVHLHTMLTALRLSNSAAQRGSVAGAKGKKKHRPGQTLAGASSMSYPSSGASGRAQGSNMGSSSAMTNEAAAGATFDKLIGRRVRTRCPAEALTTDYNAIEIPPESIRWEGDDPGISRRGSHSRSGHGIKLNEPVDRDSIPGAGRDKDVPEPSRKDYLPSQNGTGNKEADDIRILRTVTLMEEVKRFFGASRPDSVEIEKAKKLLKDYEQALTDAIANISVDERGHPMESHQCT